MHRGNNVSALNLVALVVDDDVMVRNLTVRALSREGFHCDTASDGNEALAMTNGHRYDAIVTDLRMPNMNGHAFAIEVMAQEQCPPLFVLTAVAEPRLTKDLLRCGISEVLIKPIEYPVMAAMVKERTGKYADARRSKAAQVIQPQPESPSQSTATTGSRQVDSSKDVPASIDKAHFRQGLSRIGQVMPVSKAAINIYRMSQSSGTDSRDFSCAIVKHQVLSSLIIQLANLPFYNPKHTPILNLDRGTIQIGQKRTGQFILAAAALAATNTHVSSPLDTNAIWRRSVAAGLAMELLVIRGSHYPIADGLLLCATMHEIGRVMLAALFPEHYECVYLSCVKNNRSIFEIEQATVPEAQNEVMCRALESWNVSRKLYEPLQYLHKDDEALALLPEPLRTQAELVKISSQIAQIACGSQQPGDHFEIPPGKAVDHLGLLSLEHLVQETTRNVASVTAPGLFTDDSQSP